MNNHVTGENGFLLSHLLKYLKVKECIIHFGSPSCVDEFTVESTQQMVDDVKMLLMLPHPNILFASSMGTEITSNDPRQELYNEAKRKCEKLIKSSGKNYCILKIPRVYGMTRNKGLLKFLRDGEDIYINAHIQYLDIYDFVEQTRDIVINNETKRYDNLSCNTVREIKDIYVT